MSQFNLDDLPPKRILDRIESFNEWMSTVGDDLTRCTGNVE